jgi:threonine dehydrogenase-like Zn-dependent dehydrogenase
MRAAVLHDGQVTVRDTTDPRPGPGHLLLRTLSCAICASDLHFMDHPDANGDDPLFAGYDTQADIVMGHEFIGEVVGHGPGVDEQKFPLGSRVTSIPFLFTPHGGHIIGQHQDAPGGFGELMLVSQDTARVVSDSVAADAIALTDAFAVGEGYVRTSGVTDSDVPVVVGAGAIGLSAVAALARRGISPIIVADYNADRLELARTFGAHVTINPTDGSPYDEWARHAHADGRGGRCFIYECVGAPNIVETIISECPHNARISCAGGHYTSDTVSIADATRKGIRIQFGGVPEFEDWYGTLDMIIDGVLDPLPSIGKVIGLDEVPDALRLARGAEGPPRIIVKPNGV